MKSSISQNDNFRFLVIILIGFGLLMFILFLQKPNSPNTVRVDQTNKTKIISGSFDESKLKTDEEWKKVLTPAQFHILREKGTDVTFTGELTDNKKTGTYVSIGCDQPVFRSEQKYDSGTGWPSFYAPIDENSLVLIEDYELGYKRIEILDKCGGHLGHVFDDGPTALPDGRQATGKRYCINSTALKFIPD